ncbi:ABC transporter [Geomicrobium sp. JCM 19037]|uniref:ATP-binding cassette domain-containing protein n=1 Tax=unclassified Geomicrobium TaxID=2628951 RepID=UPI00045F1D46|nr:ABC transporter ATP-binding protein [Geomicrobium sp. JCM 19037]GAK03663.1 ABC transporter [Geomicrobium sp. JCM 19037]
MIEIEQMTKSFGRKKVVRSVSFHANTNEITCLIGLNGAGKTTILQAIMNLTPSKGTVRFAGKPYTHATNRDLIFITDDLSMPRVMTVAESMEFMQLHYPKWETDKAEELVKYLKLDKNEKLKNLSKGYKMRVNLMLGLAAGCTYILMDEPLSGIDALTRENILDLLTSEFVESKTILLTTHEVGEIEAIVDRAVLLNDGEIVDSFYVESLREEEQKSLLDKMREVYR